MRCTDLDARTAALLLKVRGGREERGLRKLRPYQGGGRSLNSTERTHKKVSEGGVEMINKKGADQDGEAKGRE